MGPLAYALRSAAMLHLALTGAAIGFGWLTFDWTGDGRHVTLTLLLYGAASFALGEAGRGSVRFGRLSAPYGWWGAPIGLWALYTLSFSSPWVSWGNQARSSFGLVDGVLLVVLIGASLVALRARSARDPLLGVLAVTLIALAAGALPVSQIDAKTYSYAYPVGAGIINGLLLAASLGLTYAGQALGRRQWINVGLFFVGLLVLTRFVDVFQRLLPTALVLIGAGLLLLVLGGVLERTRRRLTGRAGELK